MSVAGIAPEVWFPVITLIVGATLKALFDVLTDRRTRLREREARHDARVDAVRTRQAEFQRVTLLELQEIVAQYVRFNGRAHHEDTVAFRTAGVWGRQQLSDGVSDGIHSSQVRFQLLAERVRDDAVRATAKVLVSACVETSLSRTETQAETSMEKVATSFGELVGRVGIVLRSLDDVEERSLVRPDS